MIKIQLLRSSPGVKFLTFFKFATRIIGVIKSREKKNGPMPNIGASVKEAHRTKVSKEKLSGDIIGKLNASRERAQRRLTLKEILADRSGMDACKHLRALNKK